MTRISGFNNASTTSPPYWMLVGINSLNEEEMVAIDRDVLLQTATEIYQNFSQDREKIKDSGLEKILFGASTAEQDGLKIERELEQWREQTPPIAAFTDLFIERFDYDKNNPKVRSMQMIAVLASVDHHNAYHNSPHFLNAFIDANRVATALGFSKEERFDFVYQMLRHDIGHAGHIGNIIDGEWSPLCEEANTMNVVIPYERVLGVDDVYIKYQNALTAATDISGGDRSYGMFIDKQFRYVFHGAEKPEMPKAFKTYFEDYAEDKVFLRLAKAVQVADIAASFSRGDGFNRQIACALMQEMEENGLDSQPLSTQKSQIGFLQFFEDYIFFEEGIESLYRQPYDSLIGELEKCPEKVFNCPKQRSASLQTLRHS